MGGKKTKKSSENRAKSADAENRNKNFMTQKNAKNNRKRNCNNSFGSKSLIDELINDDDMSFSHFH